MRSRYTIEDLVDNTPLIQFVIDELTHQPKAIIHDASLELFDEMVEQWYGLPEVKRDTSNIIYIEDHRK